MFRWNKKVKMGLELRRKGNGGNRSHNNGSLRANGLARKPAGGRYGKRRIGFALLVAVVIRCLFGLQMFQQPDLSAYSLTAEDLYNRALEMARYADRGGDKNSDNNKHEFHCSIPRFHVDDKDAVGLGSKTGPLVLEGWKAFNPGDWTKTKMMDRAGDYPQYLKDLTVQPLKKNPTTGTAAATNAGKKLRNPIRNNNGNDLCVLKGRDVANLLNENSNEKLLFFTNNKENEPFMSELRNSYKVPSLVKHIDGFEVFSALGADKYHSMHAHGESWLGQLSGRRMWWFLPPDTSPKPQRVDSCGYLKGTHEVPPNAMQCVQNPGEIIWFPKDWLHATCALDDWTAGIGAQQGKTIRQQFPKLDANKFAKTVSDGSYPQRKQETLEECMGISSDNSEIKHWAKNSNAGEKPPAKPQGKHDEEWKWFDGDLNAYYNSLETQIHDRDPSKPASYAVHRWMGRKRSTEEHYELIDSAISKHCPTQSSLKVFDGGCGLGSALMFFEKRHPDWEMTGNTISEEQYKFIESKLPTHNFHVNLRSYDDIDGSEGEKTAYDVIFSIEALIHSTDITKTMKEWVDHITPGGIIVIIDDYVSEGVDKNENDIQAFSKSWLANVLITPTEFEKLANSFGLEMVENRDLLAEYEIVKINYRNNKPVIKPVADRNHQGWMGSKWRQRLTVEGKLAYNMIVLQKEGSTASISAEQDTLRRYLTSEPVNDVLSVETKVSDVMCTSVPSSNSGERASFTEITPQLMSGRGNAGGAKMACISGWYCCNKGFEWYDHLDTHRTDNTAYLKLDRNLFGHYIEVFAKHLNQHYETYPSSFSGGRFLDIGGTGSTSSGMKKVTSKFQHFAGPLEYWKLDVDEVAESLERTLFCDIDDCPAAETCGFDVTFSHTVLEHAKRPWKSFDTIARITKQGGLTMHLVPWSYQYHATPDDNYRFSHKALITLLEDRGFDVLEVGYDICTKPDKMKERIDEHFDVIWLTYVVGKKR